MMYDTVEQQLVRHGISAIIVSRDVATGKVVAPKKRNSERSTSGWDLLPM